MDRNEILKLLEERDKNFAQLKETYAADLKERDKKFAQLKETYAADLKERDKKFAADLKERDKKFAELKEKFAADLKKKDDEIESLRNAIQDAGRNAVATHRNVEYESMTKVLKHKDGDVVDFQVKRMNDLVDARSAAQDAQVENI